MAAGHLEPQEGEDLLVKGGLERVDMLAGEDIVEDNLPAVVIHVYAHSLEMDRDVLQGIAVGERLASGGGDPQCPDAAPCAAVLTLGPLSQLCGHAHHARPTRGPVDLCFPHLAA